MFRGDTVEGLLALLAIVTAVNLVPLSAAGQVMNTLIHPSIVTQTEPIAAIHPENPDFIFASARTINTTSGFNSEGVYVSTDGGLTWSGSDSCTGELLVNHGGDPGVIVQPDGRLILTHIGSVFPGLFSHYSTNDGATWSSAVTVASGQPEDKGSTTSDSYASSPYYGRGYSALVNLVVPYPVLFSSTTNGGQTWSAAQSINNPPPARCSGSSIAVGRSGTIFVAWAGMTATSPFVEDFVGYASSTNAGANWTVSQNIFDVSGINGTLPSKANIRVNGLPQIAVDNSGGVRDGWVYIVTTEVNLLPAGTDPDIVLRVSTDGGSSWSGGIRANRDPVSNGKIQYFPAIDVDAGGGVNILFYDDRNTSSDSAEVWLARSTDGGTTWSEQVVSDHRFQPKPVAGGSSNYQGDHIALISSGTMLHAFWMDDFPGIYQIWHAIVDVSTGIDETGAGGNQDLEWSIHVFPNPFNPNTEIFFDIPIGLSQVEGFSSLKIYDLLGREVATLVEGKLLPGSHKSRWNAAGHPSGVYIARLQAGARSAHAKLLLIR